MVVVTSPRLPRPFGVSVAARPWCPAEQVLRLVSRPLKMAAGGCLALPDINKGTYVLLLSVVCMNCRQGVLMLVWHLINWRGLDSSRKSTEETNLRYSSTSFVMRLYTSSVFMAFYTAVKKNVFYKTWIGYQSSYQWLVHPTAPCWRLLARRPVRRSPSHERGHDLFWARGGGDLQVHCVILGFHLISHVMEGALNAVILCQWWLGRLLVTFLITLSAPIRGWSAPVLTKRAVGTRHNGPLTSESCSCGVVEASIYRKGRARLNISLLLIGKHLRRQKYWLDTC